MIETTSRELQVKRASFIALEPMDVLETEETTLRPKQLGSSPSFPPPPHKELFGRPSGGAAEMPVFKERDAKGEGEGEEEEGFGLGGGGSRKRIGETEVSNFHVNFRLCFLWRYLWRGLPMTACFFLLLIFPRNGMLTQIFCHFVYFIFLVCPNSKRCPWNLKVLIYDIENCCWHLLRIPFLQSVPPSYQDFWQPSHFLSSCQTSSTPRTVVNARPGVDSSTFGSALYFLKSTASPPGPSHPSPRGFVALQCLCPPIPTLEAQHLAYAENASSRQHRFLLPVAPSPSQPLYSFFGGSKSGSVVSDRLSNS